MNGGKMDGIDEVMSRYRSKYRMAGEIEAAIRTYLRPLDEGKCMDDTIKEFFDCVLFVGQDLGGETESDQSTREYFLRKLFTSL